MDLEERGERLRSGDLEQSGLGLGNSFVSAGLESLLGPMHALSSLPAPREWGLGHDGCNWEVWISCKIGVSKGSRPTDLSFLV